MERIQVRPVDEIVEENYVTCPSEFRPIGRGCDYTNNLAKINNKLNCICYRNKSRFVLCRNCGHIMNGRKRLTCPDHPRVSMEGMSNHIFSNQTILKVYRRLVR